MFGRRAWPALVVALFCLPLFYGLGNLDLGGDEAGHSFSVDIMLEKGDWLVPKQSPFADRAFLEKPPLKFWLVAGGIKAGLPHDEFGMRFWDPLFAGFAFLYLYGIGRRIAGPLCGFGAVMVMFIHGPLIFAHGLRSNNMEAALVLAYCGGFYHYFRWSSAAEGERRWPHVMAIGGYFALGFMMKFVAILFLPLVLGLVSLIVPRYRTSALRDWRLWIGAAGLALLIISPWYLWAYGRFGNDVFAIMFGEHVYQRFTTYLDPDHVHPWNYYFVQLWSALQPSNSLWIVTLGSVLLAMDGVRRRSTEILAVFLWFAVPITLISFGSSKLYHYTYAFLPPVGIAGGYLVAFLWNEVKPRLESALGAMNRLSKTSAWMSRLQSPVVRGVFLTVACAALVVVVWTYVYGDVTIRSGGHLLFRNRLLVRPLVVAMLFVVLGGWPEAIGRLGIPLLILVILPIPAYAGTVEVFGKGTPVMRETRDCIVRVGSQPALMANGPRGWYVDEEGEPGAFSTPFNHEYPFYFHSVSPWMRPPEVTPAKVLQYMFDPAEQRPLLVKEPRYHALLDEAIAQGVAPPTASLPLVSIEKSAILLPGPYAACVPQPAELGADR